MLLREQYEPAEVRVDSELMKKWFRDKWQTYKRANRFGFAIACFEKIRSRVHLQCSACGYIACPGSGSAFDSLSSFNQK